MPPLPDREALRETVRRIAERRAGRNEVNIAADIRGLLLSGYLELASDDITEVELEATGDPSRLWGEPFRWRAVTFAATCRFERK